MADKRSTRFSVRQAKTENSYSVIYSPEHGQAMEIPDFHSEAAASDRIVNNSAAWLKKLEGGQ